MTLACGLPGTDRIFFLYEFVPFPCAGAPCALLMRSCRKSYGVRRPVRFRHSLCRTWCTGSARQVRAESQPMAGQEPTASQEKSSGSEEDFASVSLGSAGAGEKTLRTISRS